MLVVGAGGSYDYFKEKAALQTKEKAAQYQYQVGQPQLVSYSRGNKRWEIRAETIIQPKLAENKEIRVILQKIEEGKLYANEKLEYKVDAERIVYFEKSKNINLFGDVKLSEVAGDTIFAEQLSWHDQTKDLTTKSGVRVELKDGQLWAQKMNLDLEKKVIDFTGDVRMTFQVKGGQENEE